MKARVLVVGVALWLGVVAAGSGITWLVIDRAGRHVVSGQETTGDIQVAGPRVTTSVPSSAPSATTRHQGSATPRPSPRSGEAASPGGVATATPGSSPHTTPRTVTRTWSGTGGRVTVSCKGSRAELVSASPADGWRVEVGQRGPEEVEVELKQAGGEGAEVQVKAGCGEGGPRFEVDRDD